MSDLLSDDDVVRMRGAIDFARAGKTYTLVDIRVGVLFQLLMDCDQDHEIEMDREQLSKLVAFAEQARGLSPAAYTKEGERP